MIFSSYELRGKDVALLGNVCTSLADLKDVSDTSAIEPTRPVRPVNINRPMEVLVLPGRQSNENLAGLQLNSFKGVLGQDANLTFQEADMTWVYKENHDLHDADEMAKAFSKGKAFKTWFDISTDDPRPRPYMWKFFDPKVKISYSKREVDNEVQKLIDRTSSGDFDVVLGLFEGCIVIHMAVAKLLEQGKPVPWKLSVLFGSMPIRDERFLGPLRTAVADHPAVLVFGKSDQDYFYSRSYQSGARPSEEYYSPVTILEGLHAHSLPSDISIFQRIAAEMKYYCGQGPKQPVLPTPPRPTSFPLLRLDQMAPRKLKVLSLCGGHSCEAINKVQLATFKGMLGPDAEWTFLAGSKAWEYYEGEPILSDMEKLIAGKSQFMNWYLDKAHEGPGRSNRSKQFDPSVDVEYYDIQECIDNLLQFINENGPFDVIVGFSQACILLHMLIGWLRQQTLTDNGRAENKMCSAEDMPWRLSIFVSGMHVRDRRWQHLADTQSKAQHPTIFINGKADEYYDYAKDGFGVGLAQEEYYQNPLILSHDQAHEFPTLQPRAREIYNNVIDHIWYHCGGRLEETVPTPPMISPGSGGKSDLKALVGPQRPPTL